MKRLIHYYSLSTSHYSDGAVELRGLKMDPHTRAYVPHLLSVVEQPGREPFTPQELLLMAAMELYAQALENDNELPW